MELESTFHGMTNHGLLSPVSAGDGVPVPMGSSDMAPSTSIFCFRLVKCESALSVSRDDYDSLATGEITLPDIEISNIMSAFRLSGDKYSPQARSSNQSKYMDFKHTISIGMRTQKVLASQQNAVSFEELRAQWLRKSISALRREDNNLLSTLNECLDVWERCTTRHLDPIGAHRHDLSSVAANFMRDSSTTCVASIRDRWSEIFGMNDWIYCLMFDFFETYIPMNPVITHERGGVTNVKRNTAHMTYVELYIFHIASSRKLTDLPPNDEVLEEIDEGDDLYHYLSVTSDPDSFEAWLLSLDTVSAAFNYEFMPIVMEDATRDLLVGIGSMISQDEHIDLWAMMCMTCTTLRCLPNGSMSEICAWIRAHLGGFRIRWVRGQRITRTLRLDYPGGHDWATFKNIPFQYRPWNPELMPKGVLVSCHSYIGKFSDAFVLACVDLSVSLKSFSDYVKDICSNVDGEKYVVSIYMIPLNQMCIGSRGMIDHETHKEWNPCNEYVASVPVICLPRCVDYCFFPHSTDLSKNNRRRIACAGLLYNLEEYFGPNPREITSQSLDRYAMKQGYGNRKVITYNDIAYFTPYEMTFISSICRMISLFAYRYHGAHYAVNHCFVPTNMTDIGLYIHALPHTIERVILHLFHQCGIMLLADSSKLNPIYKRFIFVGKTCKNWHAGWVAVAKKARELYNAKTRIHVNVSSVMYVCTELIELMRCSMLNNGAKTTFEDCIDKEHEYDVEFE